MPPGPRSEVLLLAADPQVRDALAARTDLEERLGDIVRAAREAWPDLAVPEDAFVAHVGAHLPEEPAAAARTLDALHAADLLLALACARGDGKAVRAFDARFGREIPAALSRMRASADRIDEVKQRVLEKIFVGTADAPPKIADYSGRGPLSGWLRAVVVHTAVSLARREGLEPQPREAEEDPLADDAAADPELEHARARYAPAFKAAFHEALASLESQERNVLKLHVVDGLNIEQIGKIYDVHRSTVARWIAASREKLVAATHEALRAHVPVDSAEFRSLSRLCRSQLDMSLFRVLRGAD